MRALSTSFVALNAPAPTISTRTRAQTTVGSVKPCEPASCLSSQVERTLRNADGGPPMVCGSEVSFLGRLWQMRLGPSCDGPTKSPIPARFYYQPVGLNAMRKHAVESAHTLHPRPDPSRTSNFRPINRDMDFLMPSSVDEWLPHLHPARFVVEVLAGVDLRAMAEAACGLMLSYAGRTLPATSRASENISFGRTSNSAIRRLSRRNGRTPGSRWHSTIWRHSRPALTAGPCIQS